MATINRVTLLGNVGSAETKEFGEGRKLVQVSLATSDGYKKDGEWVNKTEWHKLVFAIPALAERATAIQKGDSIYVEGSISTNSWTTKDGEKKEYTEISCTMFKKMANAKTASEKEYNQPKTTVTEKATADDDLPF
jgi:single-strand DNA-binding protein